MMTYVAYIGAASHQVEVPGPVDGVPVHDRALDAIIFKHHFLVDAALCVLQHDFLGRVVAGEIAGGKQIDAGDLEFGRGH